MREETRVVGAAHMGRAVKIACQALTVGQPLITEREPGNPHDINAILLRDLTGKAVGYVQRFVAARVAPFMDSGFMVLGRVIEEPKSMRRFDGLWVLYPRALLWLAPPPSQAKEKQKVQIRKLEDII